MFPPEITVVLEQLGYLALIIIVPATLYNLYVSITVGIILRHHMTLDDQKFADVNRYVGIHFSKIHDLEVDLAAIKARRHDNGII